MTTLLGLIDLLAVAAAWAVAYALRLVEGHVGLTAHAPPGFDEFLPYLLLSLALCPLVYNRMNLYGPKRAMSLFRELAAVCRAVFVIWVITYLITSLMRETPLSRLMMLSMLPVWLALASLARGAGRLTLRRFRARGRNIRTAAIIGAGRLGQKLHQSLARNAWAGIVVNYFVDDVGQGKRIADLPIHGPISDIETLLSRHPVDIVFVAYSPSQEGLEDLVNRLSLMHVDLRIVPNLLAVQFLRQEITQLDDIAIISLAYSPQQGWNSMLKQTFDIVVSLLLLVLLFVPLLLIALLVKLSGPGPVFYLQVRASVSGTLFRMMKFRTMPVNAEASTGPVWTQPNDPRVTAVGRFLRRTSLDELPQLINVLLGDMSLVGPRPERPELIERFKRQIPRYMLRHNVKAGITGWAQIHGLRGQTSLRKRIQYDLFYIRNWTFGLDLWIILLTPFRGLVNPNAY